MIGSDAYRVVIRLILVVFIMAASLRGNVINRGQFSSSSVIYWTNQSKAEYSKLCCDWLTKLRPGSCMLQFKQLNLCTQVGGLQTRERGPLSAQVEIMCLA